MASKRRNMFQKSTKQETKEIGDAGSADMFGRLTKRCVRLGGLARPQPSRPYADSACTSLARRALRLEVGPVSRVCNVSLPHGTFSVKHLGPHTRPYRSRVTLPPRAPAPKENAAYPTAPPGVCHRQWCLIRDAYIVVRTAHRAASLISTPTEKYVLRRWATVSPIVFPT
ncbi:hypothetical protein AAG570_002749 [Ranatra chinensis]|uniref:Uncharacterized protein n=1 Tax=Ranatra chinensis TaxID=642074 RepID=A0ABD0Y4S8_9HEMI